MSSPGYLPSWCIMCLSKHSTSPSARSAARRAEQAHTCFGNTSSGSRCWFRESIRHTLHWHKAVESQRKQSQQIQSETREFNCRKLKICREGKSLGRTGSTPNPLPKGAKFPLPFWKKIERIVGRALNIEEPSRFLFPMLCLFSGAQ